MHKCRGNPASGPLSRLGLMGRTRATLLVLALGLLAAALSACGDSGKADLLPGETASEINANLNLVEDLVAEGDCVGATNAAEAVSVQVEELTSVDKELQEALSEGAARLNEVVGECEEAPEDEEETVSTEEPDSEELEEDEKAQAKAEKDEEKQQKKEEKSEKETPPVEPPGQEKKEEKETEVPPTEPNEEDGGTPSGGVAPGSVAGGGE
jgi:outer membrane biosynthesis protein TonB